MLTPAQISQAKAASGPPPPSQPMTPEQAKASFGSGASSASAQPSYPQQVASDVGNTFTQGAQDVTKDVTDIPKNARTASVNPQKPGLLETELATAQGAGHVAGDVAGTAGKLLGSLPGFKELGQGFGTVGKAASDQLMKIPQYSQAFDQLNKMLEQNPELAHSLGDVINTASLYEGKKAEPTVTGAVSDAAQTAKDALKPTAEETAANANKAAEATKAQAAQQSEKIATEWQKPTTINKASFNKSRAALAQSPDAPKFLGEIGLDPKAHIEDGAYATADSANALRDTAGTMSKQTLRPSLQMADYTTPKTPVADVIKNAIKTATKDKSLTAGEGESISSKLTKEQAALEKKYPDGMSLTDMHDEKITYAGKGGYSPIKSADDNLSATTNRHLSSALGDTVEAKAPPEVPVHDFNQYLSKYYKAADYLDTLDTKKAPVTLGQTLLRGAAKYGGAALGAHLGGGVISGFAGYSIGKGLEHALENLTGRARASFIENIKVTNPEAYTKVEQYLKDQTSGNTGIPRLNAPSAMQMPPAQLGTQHPGASTEPLQLPPGRGSEGNPHIMGQPSNMSPNATTPMTKSTNATMSGSVPEEGKIASHQSTEAPKDESILSFIKNNIGGDKRGFFSLGGKKLSATQTNAVKDEIKGIQEQINAATRNKSPNAQVARMKQRLDGLRRLLQ